MKVTAIKYTDILHVDEACKDEFAGIANGTAVTVEVKRERNVKFHRMFFALLTHVWDSVDHDRFGSKDALLDALKLDAGVVFTYRDLRGNILQRPGSIAFAAMDQDAFKVFFNRVADLVCVHVLPGMEPGVLKQQACEMVGVPYEP